MGLEGTKKRTRTGHHHIHPPVCNLQDRNVHVGVQWMNVQNLLCKQINFLTSQEVEYMHLKGLRFFEICWKYLCNWLLRLLQTNFQESEKNNNSILYDFQWQWTFGCVVCRVLGWLAIWFLCAYNWVDHGLQSGPTLAFCCGCPISKLRPVLDFSSKKSGVVFFKNLKNELVRPKMMFLAILAKIRSFFR